MKNETAKREIESLDYYLQNHTDDYSEESHTAMMMAIKALEQEPCEDAISRSDMLDAIGHGTTYTSEDLQRIIKDLPPVKAQPCEELDFVQPHKKIGVSLSSQPKTGHWIAQDIHNCHTDFKCSECGYIHSFMHLYGKPTADYTYCPNCGAKMIEPQESEGKE